MSKTNQRVSEPEFDLSVCDREPIHIPGSIQPHGLLLVADISTMEVVAGAGDIEGRLSDDWLGRPLAALLGKDGGPGMATLASGEAAMLTLDSVQGRHETFDASAHLSGGRLVVELEPAAQQRPSAVSVLSAIEAAGATFERAGDLPALCSAAAVAFRRLTGFDRIMVYRFLENESGVVLAESVASDLASFLNHHFPASDIPRQARALYVRNRVRVIPDVHYAPAPLRPDAAWRGLDLSDAALRSVSPVHLQYMRNMGVAASASVSIVKDGLLWGLIACHNATPRGLSFDTRMACRTLASGLARQIKSKEDAETYRERVRLRAAEDLVVGRLGSEGTLAGLFDGTGPDICRMLDASGFAAVQGGEVFSTGRCPRRGEILEIAAWVAPRSRLSPFATRTLAEELPAAAGLAATASGLLATTMATDEPTTLMWFRPEQVEVVNWAGNPHKDVTADPQAALTPRSSFEAWSDEVRGRSDQWTLGEIEAATRLRNAMFEARRNRRLRDLNRELAGTVADKELLLEQKDFLIKEINHRVQNSLQLVSAFLGLQARSLAEPELAEHLLEAQRRLTAVGLVHRRLYTDDRLETVDLARYIDELCADLRTSMGAEWHDHLKLYLAPMVMMADRAIHVGLILTELVINATKYAYGGAPGPISVTLEQHQNRFRLVVADRGSGKTLTRKGFGTRMLDTMVERLSGEITEASNEPGLRVIVTAPVEAPGV